MTFNTELWNTQTPGAGGYEIERSLRFNSGDSAHLSKGFGSSGNQQKYTIAFWIKFTKFGSGDNVIAGHMVSGYQTQTHIRKNNLDQLEFSQYTGSWNFQKITSRVFRDPSSFYHIVWAVDTTLATAEDRIKLYVNGIRETNFSTNTNPGPSFSTIFNSNVEHGMGRTLPVTVANGDFYLADTHFIDGQALDPTSFGEFDATTGVWNPIEYTGTYGTNGFHLDFKDNSSAAALGYDAAGSNDWTVNNISVTAGAGNDSLRDSPTNGDTADDTGLGGQVPGNYCTWNPLQNGGTLANGNLDFANLASNNKAVYGTLGVSSGKWYFEVVLDNVGNKDTNIGIAKASGIVLNNYVGSTADSWSYISTNGLKYNNFSGTSYGASFTNGDVIGVALDVDAGTLVFYKNGSSQGTAFSGLTAGTYFPAVSCYNSSLVANFGQRAFAYTAPSGFKALCTANLPTPTIEDPSTVMDVALWTGNGGTQTISGLGFESDLIAIKCRNNGTSFIWQDSVRGMSNKLGSNGTWQENETNNLGAGDGYVSATSSTGFTVTSGSQTNENARTYAAWTWDAGSSTVSNTDGSITSSVRANASAGFSIVTYTGTTTTATVGHGLGVAPSLIIAKNRDISSNWSVYHSSLGKDYFLRLNTTDGQVNSANYWGSGGVTNTVFGLDSGIFLNTNGEKVVAYCFAPVAGYSAFGSYTGNGSSDGPFIYTGMKVKWLMVKRTDSAEPWWMWDIPRSTATPGNPMNALLRANGSDQEYAPDTAVDSLSNGFKPRSSSSNVNASGGTYVWAAFAENPFSIARAR